MIIAQLFYKDEIEASGDKIAKAYKDIEGLMQSRYLRVETVGHCLSESKSCVLISIVLPHDYKR